MCAIKLKQNQNKVACNKGQTYIKLDNSDNVARNWATRRKMRLSSSMSPELFWMKFCRKMGKTRKEVLSCAVLLSFVKQRSTNSFD